MTIAAPFADRECRLDHLIRVKIRAQVDFESEAQDQQRTRSVRSREPTGKVIGLGHMRLVRCKDHAPGPRPSNSCVFTPLVGLPFCLNVCCVSSPFLKNLVLPGKSWDEVVVRGVSY